MRVIGTAGHVDHGKSALVRALTGTDPDRWEEERRRGMTIDLGFAHTTLPGGEEIGIVDVPGHVRFVSNMLAGAGAVDACLFVVDVMEGWKPQSEEHLRVLELLGVRAGVVALTKADLADVDDVELAELDVADHTAGTFLAAEPVVAVSARTGAGMDELLAALANLVARTPASADAGRPRLWVDRAFAVRGSGTVVTGTLTGGSLAVDDRVDLVPAGVSGRVRAIQSHGAQLERTGPGRRVALNLAGVEHTAVSRGDAVVHAEQWRPTVRFDASLHVLGSLDHAVSRRGAYTVHVGAGEWPARVRILGPDRLEPGEVGAVRIHVARPLPLVAGDRYVLREWGRDETVGGGEVLDPRPLLPASRARPDRDVDRVIAEHGWIVPADLLALTGNAREPSLDRWVVSPAALAATREDLLGRVAAAGALGVDLAALTDQQRALVDAGGLPVAVRTGRLVGADAVRAEHPVVGRLRREGLTPGPVTDVDRATLRDLVRAGTLVDREGVVFHADAVEHAAREVAGLLAHHPDGVTVAAVRDHLGISRKHAVPLLAELDRRGITRRRGDLRLAGPSAPAPSPPPPPPPPSP